MEAEQNWHRLPLWQPMSNLFLGVTCVPGTRNNFALLKLDRDEFSGLGQANILVR